MRHAPSIVPLDRLDRTSTSSWRISVPGPAAHGARPTSRTPSSRRSSATSSRASTPIRSGSWLSTPLMAGRATPPARSQMSLVSAPRATPRSRQPCAPSSKRMLPGRLLSN